MSNEQLINGHIEAYLSELYPAADPIRAEMEAYAQEHQFPIIGSLSGRHLYQLALMIGAKRVFELGSGYGYSALWFARATGPDGEIHCTDFSGDNITLAEDYLSRAGVWSQITYHQEDALGALQRVGGTWDIIYNDVEKKAYVDALELAHTHLRPGGLFISDNVLWYGRVFADESPDETTQAIIDFNQQLISHAGFMTTIYNIRDGLAVAMRL